MDKKIYYIWLSDALGVQSKCANMLLEQLGDAESIYKCDDFSAYKSLDARKINKLENKDLEKAMLIYDRCKKQKIGILTKEDAEFPDRLRIISSPPVLLYYRGKLKNLNNECLISIVGTRSMTDYGRAVTRCFSKAFAASGVVVVSGMAAGVDGEAHRGCIEEGGYTVAILGTAIDKPYPKENEGLYSDIMEKGLVLSEYYPGSTGSGKNFPMRNRLISGIASATVVTEAGEHSGALITAKDAIMQGKEVFALPGLTGSPQSAGTNMLLQNGVNLAYRPSDVLLKYELLYPNKVKIPRFAYKAAGYEIDIKAATAFSEKPKKQANPRSDMPSIRLNSDIGKLEPDEEAVYNALKNGGNMLPDEIIIASGLEAGDMMSALSILEIYGIVRQDDSGRYRLN